MSHPPWEASSGECAELTALLRFWCDAVPGGATIQQLPSAPHLLMYAESGVANRMVYRFLTSALKITPPALNRPTSVITF